MMCHKYENEEVPQFNKMILSLQETAPRIKQLDSSLVPSNILKQLKTESILVYAILQFFLNPETSIQNVFLKLLEEQKENETKSVPEILGYFKNDATEMERRIISDLNLRVEGLNKYTTLFSYLAEPTKEILKPKFAPGIKKRLNTLITTPYAEYEGSILGIHRSLIPFVENNLKKQSSSNQNRIIEFLEKNGSTLYGASYYKTSYYGNYLFYNYANSQSWKEQKTFDLPIYDDAKEKLGLQV